MMRAAQPAIFTQNLSSIVPHSFILDLLVLCAIHSSIVVIVVLCTVCCFWYEKKFHRFACLIIGRPRNSSFFFFIFVLFLNFFRFFWRKIVKEKTNIFFLLQKDKNCGINFFSYSFFDFVYFFFFLRIQCVKFRCYLCKLSTVNDLSFEIKH